jgi:GT2 family glycosyltransferase
MSQLSQWQLRHVDLAVGVPPLHLDPGYDCLMVIFWWRGIPLGRRNFLANELPIVAGAVAAAARTAIAPAIRDHLLSSELAMRARPGRRGKRHRRPVGQPPQLQAVLRLHAPLAMLDERLPVPLPASVKHRLSLVICTRNRPVQLERCLRSLAPCMPYLHEVVVVDNGPGDDSTRRVADAVPGTVYVAEPRPGLSAARNAGMRQSSGDIVAFTDDDVVVHPDWAARLTRFFDDERVMCVTAQILPLALSTPAQVAFETVLGGFSQGFQPILFDRNYFEALKRYGVPVWHIGAGANMAIRRSAFELVGDFDERLGAGAAGCSEDSEFWYRLLAAGWRCRYDPTAVVFHEHRSSWQELENQAYQYMRGHVAALLLQFRKHGHWGNLYRLGCRLPLHYARLIVGQSLRGRPMRERLLWPRLRGSLAGLTALRHHHANP